MLPSSPALAAALATLFALPLAVHAAPLSTRQDSGADFASCLSSAGLSPITTSSADYADDSAAYNQRIQPQPAAILYPSTPEDIASALSCASSAGAKVSARGGGHSYASYGLGDGDGALVIDLGNFRDIEVSDTGLARVGAGNRLGDMYLAFNDKGFAFAGGTCSGVGVGGHAGFGGFGLPSRMWGFLSDQVVGYDLVLANGSILTNVTRDSNSDLFWALNGAAPNFGIVTNFHIQGHRAPARAVIAKYTYTSPSTVIAATALNSVQQFGNLSAPANLGLHATIGRDSLELMFVWYGPEAELDAVLQPLKDDLPPSYDVSVNAMSWIESAKQLAGVDDLSTNGKMLQSRDSFYAKSLMTPSTIPLSIETFEAFFTYLWSSNTSTNWFVEANIYGGQYSEINAVSLNDSSFGHRDKLMTFQLYASSPTYGNPFPTDDGIPFVQGMYDTLVDGMTSQGWSNDSASPDGYAAYVNYVDPELSADEVKNLYWGSQYQRLALLKGRYDPTQLLNNLDMSSFPLPTLLVQLPRIPAVAVGLPLACGFASGFITQKSVDTWYQSLRRPAGEPPRWAFPVVWTALYLGMGAASHLLVKVFDAAIVGSPTSKLAETALKLYWAQFALNMAWTPLFFGAHKPFAALLDISCLTPLVYTLTAKAYKLDYRTAYAFVPYCAWLTYATYLNAGFWWLNGGKAKVEQKKKDL
ncbi:hypothetical protein Rhopal_005837-T1 [Rhodotorula paludigena]|uniref:FAD-binding PCMH-type domain-containing protein n=1 Tax=Rhodotorula paludigena TaxID=86838 RepID=A0AAV5GQK4_9BASI|nr:hypothetical protein Rhopal_005837-T1 [Rhodotorula paludigena]